MFNGIELAMGVVCSLMGIAGGYLMLVTIFAGIQLMSRRNALKSEFPKKLDA